MTDKVARPATDHTPDAGKMMEELRRVSRMITLGERIAWGSETALMDQAADLIVQQQGEIERLKTIAGLALNPDAPEFMAAEWYERATNAEALLVKARKGLMEIADGAVPAAVRWRDAWFGLVITARIALKETTPNHPTGREL